MMTSQCDNPTGPHTGRNPSDAHNPRNTAHGNDRNAHGRVVGRHTAMERRIRLFWTSCHCRHTAGPSLSCSTPCAVHMQYLHPVHPVRHRVDTQSAPGCCDRLRSPKRAGWERCRASAQFASRMRVSIPMQRVWGSHRAQGRRQLQVPGHMHKACMYVVKNRHSTSN